MQMDKQPVSNEDLAARLLLKPHHLNLILQLKAECLQGATLWAYGSRVKGKAHEASDLDLVVLDAPSNESVTAFKQALSQSNLPILVDVQEWDALPEAFRLEIEQLNEVL